MKEKTEKTEVFVIDLKVRQIMPDRHLVLSEPS